MSNAAETLLKKLRKLETNMSCPNCATRAQVGIGFGNVCTKFRTFVCDLCKTSHQAISHRVKSVSMSSWTIEEVRELMDENGGGNEACRHVWLASAPAPGGRYPGGTRPKAGDRVDIFKQFVTDCYEHGKFRSTTPYTPSGSTSSSSSVPTSPRTPSTSTKSTPAPSLQLQKPTVNLLDNNDPFFSSTPTATSTSSSPTPTSPASPFGSDFAFSSSPVKPTTDPFASSFPTSPVTSSSSTPFPNDTIFEFSNSTTSFASFGFSDTGSVSSFSSQTMNHAIQTSRLTPPTSTSSSNSSAKQAPDLLDMFSIPSTSSSAPPLASSTSSFDPFASSPSPVLLAPSSSSSSSSSSTSGFNFINSTPSSSPVPVMLNPSPMGGSMGGMGMGGMGMGGMNPNMGMGGPGMGMGGMINMNGMGMGMGGMNPNSMGGMNQGMGMGGMNRPMGGNMGFGGMGMNPGMNPGMNTMNAMGGSVQSRTSVNAAMSISSLDSTFVSSPPTNFNSTGSFRGVSNSSKQQPDAFDFVSQSMKSSK